MPKKYKIEQGGEIVDGRGADRLINKETGHWFFLTNRPFEEIDHTFSHLPSRAIAELKKIKPKEEFIRILDVGGGREARAAGDIAAKYGGQKDERVKVFSVDLTARKQNREGMRQIVGSALQLPIRDDSIDMAYSRMSLSLIEEAEPEKFREALREVARVLQPGGVFFLDKTYMEKLGSPPDLKTISEELGVVFYTKELGLFLGPIERILRKIEDTYYKCRFLIMIKEPVDEKFLKSLKLKERHKLKEE